MPPRDALLEMLRPEAALAPPFPLGVAAYRGAPDVPLEAPDVPNPLEAFAGGGQASTIGQIVRAALRVLPLALLEEQRRTRRIP
jgi:hypothetical protein